jgi:hypothetical protein
VRTDRTYWFLNSDGDKECTSVCAPPAVESTKHITSGTRDTVSLIYTVKKSDTNKECVPDCQILDNTDADLHSLALAEKGYCRGMCDNSTNSLARFRSKTTVTVPKLISDGETVVEQVCSTSCENLNLGNFYFEFD